MEKDKKSIHNNPHVILPRLERMIMGSQRKVELMAQDLANQVNSKLKDMSNRIDDIERRIKTVHNIAAKRRCPSCGSEKLEVITNDLTKKETIFCPVCKHFED